MSIKAVLFDLDGTLLPMDLNVFLESYFGLLAKRMAPCGYDPKALVKAIWHCTGSMIQNDGRATNEAVFWKGFASIFGEQARADEPHFEAFYQEDFDKLQTVCGYTPYAAEAMRAVHSRGLRAILATSPLYPAIATQKRARWAGLDPEEFELITTYENSCHTKPNPDYYRDILAKINLPPSECLMVGNDVEEDMIAASVGMHVFLLTDCLINKQQKDISVYPHGDFRALLQYIEENV